MRMPAVFVWSVSKFWISPVTFQMLRTFSAISLSAIVLTIVACGKSLSSASTEPLPPIETVRSMKIFFHDPDSPQPHEFEVPAEHWENIYACLLPARRDPHPSKWLVQGTIDLKLKNGADFFVMLSNVDGFASDETLKERVYYLGADNEKLLQAVRAAQAEMNKANEAEQ